MFLKKILVSGLVGFGLSLGLAGVASADQVTVKSGDTLSSIANTYGINYQHLANINGIANPDVIEVGQVIQTEEFIKYGGNIKAQNDSYANRQVGTQVQGRRAVATNQSATTKRQVASGSVHDQFIAAGGTEAMWQSIVMPESTGNPNVSNGRYHGLGQTDQPWGYGSVTNQTQGMINYANQRYGSIDAALAFRQSHGWW